MRASTAYLAGGSDSDLVSVMRDDYEAIDQRCVSIRSVLPGYRSNFFWSYLSGSWYYHRIDHRPGGVNLSNYHPDLPEHRPAR